MRIRNHHTGRASRRGIRRAEPSMSQVMKISLIILLIAKLSLVAGCRLPGGVTPSNGVREIEQGGTQAQPQGVSTGRAPHDMTNLAALAARNQTKPASDMALIPGGTFLMGTGHGLAAEGPVHAVR